VLRHQAHSLVSFPRSFAATRGLCVASSIAVACQKGR
jgi:hypothetical protein